MIRIYSKEEIAKIRESGKRIAEIFCLIEKIIKPGISTEELDNVIMKKIKQLKVESAFLGYKGYPKASCISVNEEVIHGIPAKEKILKEGDIVKVDLGIRYKGYIADASKTFPVGKISPEAEKLIKVTYEALMRGIKKAIAGNRVGDIGFAIESYVKEYGFTPVKEFVGHGVGLQLHEEPAVPNYGRPNTGRRLKTGMVLAIEPMINQGTGDVIIQENKWTAVTADSKLSAHFEHTVAILNDEPMILTI